MTTRAVGLNVVTATMVLWQGGSDSGLRQWEARCDGVRICRCRGSREVTSPLPTGNSQLGHHVWRMRRLLSWWMGAVKVQVGLIVCVTRDKTNTSLLLVVFEIFMYRLNKKSSSDILAASVVLLWKWLLVVCLPVVERGDCFCVMLLHPGKVKWLHSNKIVWLLCALNPVTLMSF